MTDRPPMPKSRTSTDALDVNSYPSSSCSFDFRARFLLPLAGSEAVFRGKPPSRFDPSGDDGDSDAGTAFVPFLSLGLVLRLGSLIVALDEPLEGGLPPVGEGGFEKGDEELLSVAEIPSSPFLISFDFLRVIMPVVK